VPGETQTLALAIYGALQTPGGETVAMKLALISMTLALLALLTAEWLGRRAQRWSA
jgi:molybdate transport system permease protein